MPSLLLALKMETNYSGPLELSRAFAPVLAQNGGNRESASTLRAFRGGLACRHPCAASCGEQRSPRARTLALNALSSAATIDGAKSARASLR